VIDHSAMLLVDHPNFVSIIVPASAKQKWDVVLISRTNVSQRHHNPSHDLEATTDRRPPAAPACVPQCCSAKSFYMLIILHKSTQINMCSVACKTYAGCRRNPQHNVRTGYLYCQTAHSVCLQVDSKGVCLYPLMFKIQMLPETVLSARQRCHPILQIKIS
jgi:hypothetical protein